MVAARAAATNTATVTLIGGDAGMGKTRLARKFTGDLAAFDLVLRAGCTELGPDGLPFGPFITALRRLVRSLGSPPASEVLPQGGRYGLARLLPELGDGLHDPAAPDMGRARLFEEVLLLLEAGAKQQPIVLVLEDLHWADRSTCELLTFLAMNLAEPGILVVGTYRPDEIDGPHPLRPLTSRVPGVRIIELQGLTRDQVATQLRALLTGTPDDSVLDDIFRRSGGNPMFVEALATIRDASAASLSDLLLIDIDRLPQRHRRTLDAAAVAGGPISHPLLQILVATDRPAFEESLRQLVHRRFLNVVDEGYEFRHDLIREAIAGGMLPVEQRRLHRICAEAISADPTLVSGERAHAEVALHWHAAGADAPAAESAWHAAEAARRAYAYAEQHRMLERVLRAGDKVPGVLEKLELDRSAIVGLVAEAALNAGELDAGIAFITASLAERPQPRLGAHLLRMRAAMRDRNGQDPVPDLSAGVELLAHDGDTSLRGTLLADLATAQRHRQDGEAGKTAEEALEIGRRIGDRSIQANALVTLAALAAADADLSAANELLEQAGEAARDAGAADTQLAVAVTGSDRLEDAGHHARAEQVARDGIILAHELGLARTRGTLLASNLLDSLNSLGRWEEADAVYRDAMALSPPPLYRAYLNVVQGTIEARRGAFEAAANALAEVRKATRDPSRGEESCLDPDLLECRLGQVRRHTGSIAAVLDHVLTDHDLSVSARFGWPLLAVGALSLAGKSEARKLLARMSECAGRLSVSGQLQQAYSLTFLAASSRDVPEAWEASVHAWRAIGQPYPLAESLLGAARCAMALRNRTASTELIGEAAGIADSLGAVPLQEEIARFVAGARIAAGTPPVNPAGLTAREFEVLELVAEGLSNRQIGDQLFISSKTAGVHVSNILSKLMVATRLEAAAWAHRNRIFDPD